MTERSFITRYLSMNERRIDYEVNINLTEMDAIMNFGTIDFGFSKEFKYSNFDSRKSSQDYSSISKKQIMTIKTLNSTYSAVPVKKRSACASKQLSPIRNSLQYSQIDDDSSGLIDVSQTVGNALLEFNKRPMPHSTKALPKVEKNTDVENVKPGKPPRGKKLTT